MRRIGSSVGVCNSRHGHSRQLVLGRWRDYRVTICGVRFDPSAPYVVLVESWYGDVELVRKAGHGKVLWLIGVAVGSTSVSISVLALCKLLYGRRNMDQSAFALVPTGELSWDDGLLVTQNAPAHQSWNRFFIKREMK